MSEHKKVTNPCDGYAATCKKTAHNSVFTKWKGKSQCLLQKPLGSVMYSAF